MKLVTQGQNPLKDRSPPFTVAEERIVGDGAGGPNQRSGQKTGFARRQVESGLPSAVFF
jgi:hypothetical protein